MYGGGFYLSIEVQSDQTRRMVIASPPRGGALSELVPDWRRGYQRLDIARSLGIDGSGLQVRHGEEPTGGPWTHAILTVAEWAAAGLVGNAVYGYLKKSKPSHDDDIFTRDRFWPGALTAVEAAHVAQWVVCAEFHQSDCDCGWDVDVDGVTVVEERKVGPNEWCITLRDAEAEYEVDGISTGQFYAEVVRRSFGDSSP
jgi:hypothetical protein